MHIGRHRDPLTAARLLTDAVPFAMDEQMERDEGDLDRLAAQARLGDQASRNELLRTIRLGVLRYLLARGLPDDDAQDLAQETCLGVIKALSEWRDVGKPLWALVFAIARNKVADRTRAFALRREVLVEHHGETAGQLVDPQPGPAELAEHGESASRVQAMLHTLPSTQREVLLLRVMVGLSTAETAEALTLTVGSVRVLQHRAVTALRAGLAVTPGGTP